MLSILDFAPTARMASYIIGEHARVERLWREWKGKGKHTVCAVRWRRLPSFYSMFVLSGTPGHSNESNYHESAIAFPL